MSSSNPNAPYTPRPAIRDIGPPEVKIVLIVGACVAFVVFVILAVRWIRRERRRVALAEHARVAAEEAELLRLKRPKRSISRRDPCFDPRRRGPSGRGPPRGGDRGAAGGALRPSPRAAAASPPAGEGSLPGTPRGRGPPGRPGASTDAAACALCLSDYEAGELLRRLPCRHAFHAPCIDPWLASKASCPLCAFDVRAHLAADPATRPSSASAPRPPRPRAAAALPESPSRRAAWGEGAGPAVRAEPALLPGPETPLEPEAAPAPPPALPSPTPPPPPRPPASSPPRPPDPAPPAARRPPLRRVTFPAP
eukprot:tig00001527_g9260.t1